MSFALAKLLRMMVLVFAATALLPHRSLSSTILDNFVSSQGWFLDTGTGSVQIDLLSKEECAYACLQRTSPNCLSFSYHSNGWCHLYEVLSEESINLQQDSEQFSHSDRKIDCEGGFRRGLSCYFIISNKLTRSDAATTCQAEHNAQLANLHEIEELDWLSMHLNGDQQYWIALKDKSNRGSYMWSNGLILSYSDRWSPGDPEAENGSCVTTYSNTLSTSNCSTEYPAVCERINEFEALFTPTPNTAIEFFPGAVFAAVSEDACKLMCVNENDFFCRSYLYDGSSCELSNFTATISTPGFHNKKSYNERIMCPRSCNNGGTMDLTSCRCLCPVGWGGMTCERQNACFSPLGMENHGIPDGRITSSSVAGNNTGRRGQYGRLNDRRTPSAGWVGNGTESLTWLQVDLGELTVLTGVGTQSSGMGGMVNRAVAYTVQYSTDGNEFEDYTEKGTIRVFIGNYADNILVVHELSTPLVAQTVRIVVTDGDPALRLELYGCPSNNLAKGKTASQSSVSAGNTDASNALDDTVPSGVITSNCVTTGVDTDSWWIVDIGEMYELIAVAIVKAPEPAESLVGTEIRIGMSGAPSLASNTLCGTVTSDDTGNGNYILKHCGDVIQGQYVSLQLTSGVALSVCEVLVYANTHPCGPGGISHNGRCYAFYERNEEGKNYGESMTFCYSERWGSLLDIENLDEFEWMSYNAGHGNSSYLIGLNNLKPTSDFLWTDGTELGYDKWDEDQPDNSGFKNCVVMATSGDGSMYRSVSCEEKLHFVCEYAPGKYDPITETSPLGEIAESLHRLGKSLGIDSSEYVLEIVKNKITDPGYTLSEEDLLDTIVILQFVTEYAAMEENTTKAFLSIVNDLLRLDHLETYTEALQVHQSMLSEFLSLMEEFTLYVAQYKQTEPYKMEYVYSNIVVFILKLPTSNDTDIAYTLIVDGREINITVPHGAFQPLDVFFGAIAYPTLSAIMAHASDLSTHDESEYIGSDVLSTFMHSPSGDVTVSDENQLDITFSIDKKSNYNSECSFWKLDNDRHYGGDWSREGCVTSEDASNENITKCTCNHMTSFAVLMQVVEFENHSLPVLSYISYIGGVCSIICLVITLACYGILKLYTSQRIIIHANLTLALLIALCMTLFGLEQNDPQLCKFIAVTIHYSWMAVFVWMLVEGILLYVKTNAAFSKGVRTWIFGAIGWGMPLIIVGVTLAVHYDNYEDKKSCWLSIKTGSIWAFVGPALFVIALNTVVMVMVIRILMTLKANIDKTEMQRLKAGVRAVLILQPLLGLTWLFGLFAVSSETVVFQYLFVILNSTQGVLIFLFQCVTNDEVTKAFVLRRKRLTSTLGVSSMGRTSSYVRSASVTESSVIDKMKNQEGTTSRTNSASSCSKKAWL